jgi:putative oxidoreductase
MEINVSTYAARYAGLLGRLLIAALFLFSAVEKLATPITTIALIRSAGLPLAQLGFLIALVFEIGGGMLLIAGYRTRLTASLLALYAILTALFFHHDLGDQNQSFHFLKNLAIAGGLLQLAAFGAGGLSLDARWLPRFESPAAERQ